MTLLNFPNRRAGNENPIHSGLCELLSGYSIEVVPRTAAKVKSFSTLLPRGTLVYIAHIEGTPIDAMVTTARRLAEEGFAVMPHFPARLIEDRRMLETWIGRYREEAGVERALVLAGGRRRPVGAFDSSMALLETGLFDRFGFSHLHVAGHPEGSRDIDPDGSTRRADEALRWKQHFAQQHSDARMAIVTQFLFDAAPLIAWSERLARMGITLPIHVGVAGPAKLQTLMKYALACGVGPSLRVLQKRAMDVRKLMLPYEPTVMLSELAAYRATRPDSLFEQVHIFPLGGVRAAAEWANAYAARQREPGAA